MKFNDLINFIRDSIVQREYSKFIFSKSIDLIFSNLNLFAKKNHINKNELSYLKINDITDFYYNLDSGKTNLKIQEMIEKNKKDYHNNLHLKLPDVILNPKDLYVVDINKDVPNYITGNICEGSIIKLNINKQINLRNKIVCIENADPGYDFIFSHNIKGLITKYGGFNSHMSIRC